MSVGIGYGKTILFGEHFVVYGLPGVASAINNYTKAIITDSKKFEFVDNRPETPGYKEKKKNEIKRQLKSLLKSFGLNEKTKIRIELTGTLICASGMGASAALAASIAKALNKKLSKKLTLEQINEIAFKAEEAGSGPASGIDNTCAVYGGLISFTKNLKGKKNKIELIELKKPVKIVLANSGITQETKKIVASVKEWKEKNKKKFLEIEKKYLQVYEKGLKALKKGNWKKLGELINQNQELLKQITVSCKELDEMQKIALNNGALGAKLTGTGRGGLMICLTPTQKLQEKIAKKFNQKQLKTIKTIIGVKK